MFARLIAAALLAATVLIVTPARADESARASARILFDEGKGLMKVKKYKAACQKFAASRALASGPGILFNLAECYEKINKVASAWSLYLDVARLMRDKGDKSREASARGRAKKLRPRLPRIALELTPAGVEGAWVERDGVRLPPSQIGNPIVVDLGHMVLRAGAPGYVTNTKEIDVTREGKTETFVVKLVEDPSAAPVPPTPPTPPRPAPDVKDGGINAAPIVGISLVSAGVITGVVGAVLAAVAIGQISTLQDSCDGPDQRNCGDPDVVAEGNGLRDERTTGFAIGGVGLGVAVIGAVILIVDASSGKTTDKGGNRRRVRLDPWVAFGRAPNPNGPSAAGVGAVLSVPF